MLTFQNANLDHQNHYVLLNYDCMCFQQTFILYDIILVSTPIITIWSNGLLRHIQTIPCIATILVFKVIELHLYIDL